MAKLILASASPRRQELLSTLGVELELMPADIDESSIEAKTPAKMAEAAAYAKARWVTERVSKGIIVAADTIVLLDSGKFWQAPRS